MMQEKCSLYSCRQINKFLNLPMPPMKTVVSTRTCKAGLVWKDRGKAARSEDKVVNNVISQWFATYFKFVAYFIIGIYIAVIGLVMADFKESKIRNRVKISSKKAFQLNKELYIGQLTLAILISLFFISGSVFLKGKYIFEVRFSKYIINLLGGFKITQ